LIPLAKRGKGGVGYYSLDTRREGTSRLRGIGRAIRGNARRGRRKGRGDDPRQLVEPRPRIVYMRAVLAVWIKGGVDERLTVDT
jgi:hypothetical protein